MDKVEMALKDTKGQQAKKATGLSYSNAESILKLLQGPDVAGLTQELKAYIAPLNSVSGPGKENTSKTELHRHAKQFVPFLVQLLKLCSASVATAPAADEGPASVKKGDEVFAAMEIALDSLDALRSFLTGSAFEIEIQRCALVRRLLAWRRHSAALAQCKKNFNSLHVHLLAPKKDSLKKVKPKDLVMCSEVRSEFFTSFIRLLISMGMGRLVWFLATSSPTTFYHLPPPHRDIIFHNEEKHRVIKGSASMQQHLNLSTLLAIFPN